MHWNTIPYHRFISGNEAHTDDTKIKQEDRKSVGLQRKTLKHRKHTTHNKTTKTENEHTYTSTQLYSLHSFVVVDQTGETFTSLQYLYRLGRTTVGEIVLDTCQAIADTLQEDFLKVFILCMFTSVTVINRNNNRFLFNRPVLRSFLSLNNIEHEEYHNKVLKAQCMGLQCYFRFGIHFRFRFYIIFFANFIVFLFLLNFNFRPILTTFRIKMTSYLHVLMHI